MAMEKAAPINGRNGQLDINIVCHRSKPASPQPFSLPLAMIAL